MGTKNFTEAESEALKELEAAIERVSEEDVNYQPLFHYTDANGFSEILRTGEIWATHFRFLNDSKELHHGEDLIMAEAARLQDGASSEIQREFFTLFHGSFPDFRLSSRIHVFISSFSEVGDQLSQWRAYGGGGSGYAIGFQQLPKGATEGFDASIALDLYKCSYDETEFCELVRERISTAAETFERLQPRFVQDAAREHALGTAMTSLFMTLAYETPRLKHSGFSEEKEWRLVAITAGKQGDREWPESLSFRTRSGVLVPFLKISCKLNPAHASLSLAKVVVGPAEDPERARLAARLVLQRYGYDPDIVVASGVPFRSR